MTVNDVCGDAPTWVCRTAYDWTGSDFWTHIIDWVVAKPLTIALIALTALIVNHLLRRAIRGTVERVTSRPADAAVAGVPPALLVGAKWAERREARAQTLGTVLRSITSIVVWTVAVFAVLGVLNINLGPFIAGAGVVGIAIGFGAQSFVRDCVSGIFMLIEDQYGVGDSVDLGEASGTVERVSIRVTRLRDVFGVVWYVPNGEIRRVGNKSQDWARALLDVTLSYEVDIAEASRVILETAEAVVAEPAWRDGVLEEPAVWGVEEFSPSGISIRLVIKTRPAVQFDLMRELRGRLKQALDAAGIPLAYEQAMRVQVRGDES